MGTWEGGSTCLPAAQEMVGLGWGLGGCVVVEQTDRAVVQMQLEDKSEGWIPPISETDVSMMG